MTQTTVESNNSTAAPTWSPTNTYDADNRVISTTVDPGGGTLAATTQQAYDPNGNVFCSGVGQRLCGRQSTYQCPAWQPGWIASPAPPSSLYSTTPTSAQANNVTTTFYNADGEQVQTTNPDVETTVTAVDGDGRTYCSADPTNVAAWLTAHPSGTYPYLCPATPPRTAPPRAPTRATRPPSSTPPDGHLSSTDQVGDTTTYTYDPAGHVLTTTDPRGKVTTDCYYYQNGSGQCAHGAPAGGGSGDDLYSTTTPATTADPSGETTTYTYYPGGQADTTTTPAGTTTDAYDAAGDLTSTVYIGHRHRLHHPGQRVLHLQRGRHPPHHDRRHRHHHLRLRRQRRRHLQGPGRQGRHRPGQRHHLLQLLHHRGAGLGHLPLLQRTTPARRSPTPTTPPGPWPSETDWLGNEVTFAHDTDGNPTGQDNNVTTANPNGTSSTAWTYDNADSNTGASLHAWPVPAGTETPDPVLLGHRRVPQPRRPAHPGHRSPTAARAPDSGAYQRDYSYDLAGRVVYQGIGRPGLQPQQLAYDACRGSHHHLRPRHARQLRHLHPDLRQRRRGHRPEPRSPARTEWHLPTVTTVLATRSNPPQPISQPPITTTTRQASCRRSTSPAPTTFRPSPPVSPIPSPGRAYPTPGSIWDRQAP